MILTPYARESSVQKCFQEVFGGLGPFYDRFFSIPNLTPTLPMRQELRKLLVASLEQFVDISKEKACLLKPGKRPFSTKAAISLSHCKVLGGFIFCLNPEISLGFDVEEIGRIKLPIVQRFSHPTEVREAPNKAYLWVAKEAVFKCLFPKDASVLLGQIVIHRWRRKSHYDLFQFEFKQYQGQGMILIKEGLVFGGTGGYL